MFDHERLDVYQLELRFIAWLALLLDETRDCNAVSTREIRDQVDLASISIVLNTAEGNGKRQRPVRAKYFDDARGSVTEAAACLDVMVAKGICPSDRVIEGKEMLARIGQMLTRMVQLYDDKAVREEQVGY